MRDESAAGRWSAWATALLGLALRLPNLGWGLPDVAEEAYPLKKALAMWGWQQGHIQWDPQTVGWPSLSFYLHLLLQHLHYAVGRLTGRFADRLDYLVSFTADHHDLLLLSRLLGVLAACGLIFVTARLARRLTGPAGGWLAGLLLAFSPLLIHHSQLITPDILLTFFAGLALQSIVDIHERGRRRDYVLAGLWLGLGASCKYTPAVLYIVLYVAHLLARHRDAGRLAPRDYVPARVGLAVLCGAAAFLATSPYFLVSGGVLGRDVGYQMLHLQQGHFGHGTSVPGIWYYLARVLAPGLGLPALVLGLAGLGLQAWRRRGVWLLLLLAVLVFLVPLSLIKTRFDRYLLPALMPLALGLAAWTVLLDDLLRSRLTRRDRDGGRRLALAGVLVVVLALLPTGLGAWHYHATQSRPSTLQVARDFILTTLAPSRPVLAMEAYTPQLQDEFRSELHGSPVYPLLSPAQRDRVKLDERITVDYIPIYSTRVELAAFYYDLRHYAPYTHIVTSSSVAGRYLAEPARFPEQVRFYADLDRYARLVARFGPGDGLTGPEIRIYAVDRQRMAALVQQRGELPPDIHQAYADRLHAPHFRNFVRDVARRAERAEMWSHAARYYDMLADTADPVTERDKLLAWLERSSYTHLRAGEFERSAWAAELYLERQPESARLWGYLGQARVGQGDLEQGRQAYERCRRIAAGDPALAEWRQWADERLTELDEAAAPDGP